MKRFLTGFALLALLVLSAAMLANAGGAQAAAPDPGHEVTATSDTFPGVEGAAKALLPASAAPSPDTKVQANCALLDDPTARGLMSGMFETRLLVDCGRADELGGVTNEMLPPPDVPLLGTDVQVNDSAGDSGASTTQSETSIALNENTGTICSGYNDSFHGVVQSQGFTGFSRSTDGGLTFSDGGPLGASSSGDPGMIWRRTDGYFYLAALHTSGLGIWRSTDDCASFQFVNTIHVGSGDDKELMAVDNNPGSPYYGRIYTGWTDFNAGARIYSTYSDDGGTTWSSPVAVSASGVDVQGAWPAVAPNGDVYMAWVRWNPYPSGPVDIEVARSTNGGSSYSLVTNPLSGEVNPRDAAATSTCGRPALNGNIRYLPSPQITVSPNGDLHVVYSYDQDGFNTGDVIDVFYRRSTDNGATWLPEIQLNDDGTLRDQYFPTVSVGSSGRVVSTWYDRRLDSSNYLFDYYMRVSDDGGATWAPSVRVSDVSSPVYIDPNLATCYHGDYDTQVQDGSSAYIQWSDDRNMFNSHNDPDVWFDRDIFAPDFTLDATPANQAICAPTDATYTVAVGQVLSYTDPVTLSTVGEPAGTTATFSPNGQNTPYTSTLTIGNTGAASAGSYGIDVVGMAPTSTHTATLGLDLYTATPGTPTLVSPADSATGVDLVPTFEWQAATQGQSYFLEVAEDSGFTTVVYSTTVPGTTATPNIALDPLSTYYWRVAPSNVCGDGAASATWSFETRDIPPILVVDDDDNSPDVRSYYTDTLDNLGAQYDVWDTGNSDNEPTETDLLPYETVIWFTGDEFGGAAGPGSAGEGALGNWLDGGKCLFISSQDYHYDRGLTTFMDTYLGVASASNDDGDYTSVSGQGSVFGGLGPYSLDYGPVGTDYSDIVSPDGDAELAFLGSNSNDAAVNKDSGVYRTTFWGYSFEAISTAADREEAMDTILGWCGAGGATGTLTGSITNANTGTGIAGAMVTADSGTSTRTTTADGNGVYSVTLGIGTYDVTASATGYMSDTVTGVTIVTDTVTTTDIALQPAAAIDLNKTVGTDPNACATTSSVAVAPGTNVTYCYDVTNTGALTLTEHDLTDSELGSILSGFNFSLAPGASVFVTQTATISATTVNTATWTAYNPGPTDVASDTDTATVTIQLPLSCNSGSVQFENGIPADWTVVDNTGGAGIVWVTTASPDCGIGNLTNGSGEAACADSDAAGSGSPPYDTELVSPPLDLTGYNTASMDVAGYYSDLGAGNDLFEVDVWDGSVWTNVLTWDEDHEPEDFTVDLTAYAGTTNTQVRFRYSGDGWDWYAEVDDVTLTCENVAEPPDIDVTPTSISGAQGPDVQVTWPLTIANLGEMDLDWTIDEAAPPAPLSAPAGTTERLGETKPFTNDKMVQNALSGGDIVQDGGFEAGTPNAFWNESSTNFGTPICDVASCGTGTGTGPHNGAFWTWFGGIGAYEEGSVSQDVTIPTGTATLSFWLEQIICDSPADYAEVLIDGTQVFLTDGSSALCGVLGYAEQTVDVSAYADGGTHTLEFHSEIFANNGGGSNFFVDDVAITVSGPPSACDAPTDIPWASVSPDNGTTISNTSSLVDVTFDSTGYSSGTYTGTLCINSNDPDEPLVQVPLTMTVAMPSVAMTQTLSMDGTCGTVQSMTMPWNTDVTFCYTMQNTGDMTMTTHWMSDTMHGMMMDAFMYELAPGETYVYTTTTTMDAPAPPFPHTINNCAEWTAEAGPGATAEAQSCADVTITAPTDVSLTGFGGETSAMAVPLWLATAMLAVLGLLGFVWRRRLTR